jgi:SAM-dependent methyltransferase
MNRFHRWYCRSDAWKKTLGQELLPWALKGVDLGQDVLEVGPGPGLTTDALRARFGSLTSIEIDRRLAESLGRRLQGTNVGVLNADATSMPFQRGIFSGAVTFTVLHHVPSAALQDRLIREVFRVLKPGGVFVGTDSVWSRRFQLMHLFDTMVVVDPMTFGARLEGAGFTDVSIRNVSRAFSFRARKN